MRHLIQGPEINKLRDAGMSVSVQCRRLVSTPDGADYMTRAAFTECYPYVDWNKALIGPGKTYGLPLAITTVKMKLDGFSQTGTYRSHEKFDRKDSLGRAATEAFCRLSKFFKERLDG